MNKKISKEEFTKAEIQMEKLLGKATQKGAFEFLKPKENSDLDSFTKIVKDYEDQNITMPIISH